MPIGRVDDSGAKEKPTGSKRGANRNMKPVNAQKPSQKVKNINEMALLVSVSVKPSALYIRERSAPPIKNPKL